MINDHNLKNCMHKLGDRHLDLIGIKLFLNSHGEVKIFDIPGGFEFCAKTISMLFQLVKKKQCVYQQVLPLQ